MNAPEVLKYGNSWFLETLQGIPEGKLEEVGVAGTWSVKDILSHITSYEIILINTLREFIQNGKSVINPIKDDQKFNDNEVSKRKNKDFNEILSEYNKAHEDIMALIFKITPQKCLEKGTLVWYGKEYSLDDYLVYAYYGHKREHGAQIALFRDKLN